MIRYKTAFGHLRSDAHPIAQLANARANAWLDRALFMPRPNVPTLRGVDSPLRTLEQAAREVFAERCRQSKLRTLESAHTSRTLSRHACEPVPLPKLSRGLARGVKRAADSTRDDLA